MGVIKVDMTQEKKKLQELIANDKAARKAYDEFQAKVAFQEQLIQMRKSENMTQTDVAHVSGLTQQAVSRIEKGQGLSLNSLIKYLHGIGCELKITKIIG